MAVRNLKVARTATEGLKLLWLEGFLREWRNWSAIKDALAKKGNHFTDAELGMALKRAKHLTRRGKPGKFEYVQKFPATEEGESDAALKIHSREQERSRRAAS